VVDKNILWSKISAMQKHLDRVRTKRDISLHAFIHDLDRQESVLFNLQMAIQNCIDMAAHIVSEKGLGVPGSTNELFYSLEEHGLIEHVLTEGMVQCVGFRNLIVHQYGQVDLETVFRVCHEDIQDLQKFAKVLGERFG